MRLKTETAADDFCSVRQDSHSDISFPTSYFLPSIAAEVAIRGDTGHH